MGFTGKSRPLVSAEIFIKDQDCSKRLNKSFVNWTSTAGHYFVTSVALSIISYLMNYWVLFGIITDASKHLSPNFIWWQAPGFFCVAIPSMKTMLDIRCLQHWHFCNFRLLCVSFYQNKPNKQWSIGIIYILFSVQTNMASIDYLANPGSYVRFVRREASNNVLIWVPWLLIT